MQGLLLDTNALFYYVTASTKFGARTRKLLDNSELYFSPLSVVELKQKSSKGKLALSRLDPEVFVELGMNSISFSSDAAHTFELLANDDPFDNMLLAQAKASDMKFLTADLKILKLELTYVLNLTD
jgi:PIN domain nuclease of toxin-antitoxin system